MIWTLSILYFVMSPRAPALTADDAAPRFLTGRPSRSLSSSTLPTHEREAKAFSSILTGDANKGLHFRPCDYFLLPFNLMINRAWLLHQGSVVQT